MAAVFLAQATNTPLDISHQLYLLAILLLTSKGAAAVSGGGFITLAATLQTVGTIPVASLTLLLGVDRFMGLLGCEDVCPKEIPLQEQLGKLRRKMALAAVKNLLPKFLKKDF